MESVVLNGPTYRLAITVVNVSNSKWKIVHCYVIYYYLYDNSNICNVLHLTNMFSFTSPPTSTPTTLTTTTQCTAAPEDATATTTSVTMVR